MPVVAESDWSSLVRARRILVLGSPGSGKTHLSTALGRHLGLSVLRLDDHFWKPGRVRLPTNEWRARVVELAARPDWIMDGTYEASLDLRLPKAEAIVYIESSRWACLWRIARRRLLSRWGWAESAPGQALTAFFVRYVFRFPASTRPEVFDLMARHAQGKPVLVVDGRDGVDRFIERLEQRPVNGDHAIPATAPPVELQRHGRS